MPVGGEAEMLSARPDLVVSCKPVASPTLERAYALARSGMCACIADLRDRLIREGHGALEVLGLLGASSVARDIGQVIATSYNGGPGRRA